MAEAAAGADGGPAVGHPGADDGGANGGGGGGVPAGAEGPAPRTTMDIAITALKAQRERLAQEKKRVRKDLKNALKKRSRLKKKASGLSNADLFDIMRLRDLPGAEAPEANPAAAAAAGGNANGAGEAAAGALMFASVSLCAVFFFSFWFLAEVQKDGWSWEQSAPGSCRGSGGPLMMFYRIEDMRYAYTYVRLHTHS